MPQTAQHQLKFRIAPSDFSAEVCSYMQRANLSVWTDKTRTEWTIWDRTTGRLVTAANTFQETEDALEVIGDL